MNRNVEFFLFLITCFITFSYYLKSNESILLSEAFGYGFAGWFIAIIFAVIAKILFTLLKKEYLIRNNLKYIAAPLILLSLIVHILNHYIKPEGL